MRNAQRRPGSGATVPEMPPGTTTAQCRSPMRPWALPAVIRDGATSKSRVRMSSSSSERLPLTSKT